MKKLFISAAVLLASLAMNAQVFNAGGIQAVPGVQAGEIALSPDGSFMVAVTENGIEKVTLATGERRVVAKQGNVRNLKVSADGNHVVYMRKSTKDKKQYTSLETAEIATGKTQVLVKPSRRLGYGYAVEGNTANAVNAGKAQAKRLAKDAAQRTAFASINYGHLDITGADGKTTTIDPQGRGSYIWASVNPAGTRVCYWLVGAGCFTCDLDGSNVKSHGRLQAAVWAGNDALVGMDAIDDGKTTVASSIVAIDTNTGALQRITEDDIVATYPVASQDGSRIAFLGDNGTVYTVSITK